MTALPGAVFLPAAGTLPNTRGHLAAWIADPQAYKPGNRMPATFLPAEDMQALLGTVWAP